MEIYVTVSLISTFSLVSVSNHDFIIYINVTRAIRHNWWRHKL